MGRTVLAAGTGQAVNATSEIKLNGVTLTSGGAASTAVIYSNGVAQYYFSVGVNGTYSERYNAGDKWGESIPGPVTADVVGAGAHLTLDF